MYKIKVNDLQTGLRWYQYGFSHYILKNYFELTTSHMPFSFDARYEVELLKLGFSLNVFKKCLFKETWYLRSQKVNK